MRTPGLQNKKIKRILMYDRELERLKISSNTSLDFISYIFSIREQRILQILRNYTINEIEVELDHWDLDLKIIDAYATKLHKQARKERKEQLHLEFN